MSLRTGGCHVVAIPKGNSNGLLIPVHSPLVHILTDVIRMPTASSLNLSHSTADIIGIRENWSGSTSRKDCLKHTGLTFGQGLAAVDDDGLTGHVTCLVAGQVERRIRDVLGYAQFAHRNCGHHHVLLFTRLT